MPMIDVLFWAICEFCFAFIFYNTGALLIRMFSLGKIAYPLTGSKNFTREDLRLQRASACYLAGLVFYLVVVPGIVLAVIFLLNNTVA